MPTPPPPQVLKHHTTPIWARCGANVRQHVIVHVRKDVLLHRVSLVDAREQLGMHLVPRASDLAHQESFEWRKVFVEPFAVVMSNAHADLRRPFVGRHELTKTHFSTTAKPISMS